MSVTSLGSREAPWGPSAVDSGGVAVAVGIAAMALRSAGGVVPKAPSLAALAASDMSDVEDGLAATSLPPPLNARSACRLSDSLHVTCRRCSKCAQHELLTRPC